MTELILIRHGQTQLNRGPFFQGQIDVPLNSLGLEQAARLAERLAAEAPRALVSSDLLRTRQTAEPASRRLVLTPQLDAALREQHFGRFEGLSFEECDERYPDAFAAWLEHRPDFAVPGGESVIAFHARVVGAVRAVAAAHPDARIAVVTHGGVLDMVWRTAQGLPLSGPRTCAIPNAGLNRIRVRGESIEIVSWGDDAHVADLGPAPGPAPTEGAAEAAAATIHPGPDAADRTG